MPWGRRYLEGAAPPLPDQVEGIGVTGHGLQESLTSTRRDGGLTHAQFGVPWVRVVRSPVSQLTDLWPCMSGTAQRDCPWPSLSREVLWTCRA